MCVTQVAKCREVLQMQMKIPLLVGLRLQNWDIAQGRYEVLPNGSFLCSEIKCAGRHKCINYGKCANGLR